MSEILIPKKGPVPTELMLLAEEGAASLKGLTDTVLGAEKGAYNISPLLAKMLAACKVLRTTDLASLPRVVQVLQGVALGTKKIHEEGLKHSTLSKVGYGFLSGEARAADFFGCSLMTARFLL